LFSFGFALVFSLQLAADSLLCIHAREENIQGMKTKTLFSAVVLATGIVSTAVAQSNVYSLNVVGYYNIPVAANQKVLLGNQLHTTNDILGAVIPNPPPLSQFFKYNGGFTTYQFDDVDLVWTPNPNVSLAPGEGGFFISPVNTTLTFVGEVLQGSLTNTLPLNTKVIRCPMVPLAGRISIFGLPFDPLDQFFQFNGGFTTYQYDDVDLVWTPFEPSNAVGQAFFYIKNGPHTNWVQNFTVQ
jgi:hypothetical protein